MTYPKPIKFNLNVYEDNRGFFMEVWNKNKFDINFVQDNHSRSIKGVLRGLHYQLNKPQGKYIKVVSGTIFDVAIDIRKSSPDFGKTYEFVLSDVNHTSVYIPPGFAHGFLALTDSVDFIYKCTTNYDPQSDRSLSWNDPILGIDWPMENMKLIMSDKDRNAPMLNEAELFE
jgi:dTDP-4-dehydrorhamnose 3,5-epimerase